MKEKNRSESWNKPRRELENAPAFFSDFLSSGFLSRLSGTGFLFLCFLALLALPTRAARADFGVYESPLKPGEAKIKIESVLKKIDRNRYREADETAGFAFLFKDSFKSPFQYRIYGGTISRQLPKTIIRIESGAGDVDILADILQQEKILKDPRVRPQTEPRRLQSKSHFIAQGLNLAAPWLAVPYIAYRSPRLTRYQAWYRSLAYLLLDVALVYGAGTRGFKSRFRVKGNEGNIAAALAFNRMIGMYQNFNMVRGHNRLAEMKYVFYFK